VSALTDEGEVLGVFEKMYGTMEGVTVASAPGRVNIIGEHTDYNEGFVLPTPISQQVWVACRKRGDEEFRLYAKDYGESYNFTLGKQAFSEERRWANYVMGVVDAMQRKGHRLGGVDLVIKGDVPQAAGLSSSAALEVATARALVGLFDLRVTPVQLAYIGKSAENDFIGLQSGVMDQFCASMGKLGYALLIDCKTNKHRNIKIPEGYSLVAIHSGIRRKLDSSAYNERVQQCRSGVLTLQRVNPKIQSLRDATLTDLVKASVWMSDVVYKRCKHVVLENERVLSATAAMEINFPAKVGALMFESHKSLREDYEVSCPELDALVDRAFETGYVLGARLTGAGWGGCTINLLPKGNVAEFVKDVPAWYAEATGLIPEVYPV
jgi:galactokinase